MTQVRACAQHLVGEAKRRNVAIVLVGHVTKDGALAGPRVLEHIVDTVLSFDGDRHHALRLLRAVKHRFGATEELGLFEMTAQGLVGVPDASKLLLADRRSAVPGSVVVPAMDGRRPLLVEVQALTVPVPFATPARRNAQGVDGGRLALLLAVLERRAGIRVADQDVYASVVGGIRLHEPGTDLPLALAVASAVTDVPLPGHVVVTGEIGLGGEIRQVSHVKRRLAEAVRMGFERAIVPHATPDVAGMQLQRVRTLGEALIAARMGSREPYVGLGSQQVARLAYRARRRRHGRLRTLRRHREATASPPAYPWASLRRGAAGSASPWCPWERVAAAASSCEENQCAVSMVPHVPSSQSTSSALPSRFTSQSGDSTLDGVPTTSRRHRRRSHRSPGRTATRRVFRPGPAALPPDNTRPLRPGFSGGST